MSSLRPGFALAVQPVSRAAITTDTEGLEAGEVRIPVTGGQIPAYQAMPAKGKRLPMVLVVHEIFGVHEYIQDVCRRLAKLGYLALAPDLCARQGDVSQLADIQEIIGKVVSKVPDEQVMSDLDAAVKWVHDSGHGDAARLGITGFCWGGRIVWLYAAHHAQLSAGVAWYGRLTGATDPLHPRNPIDVVKELRAPVLGLYGEADQGIPAGSVEQMRQAIQAADQPCELILYSGAGHGFHADYRPAYHRQAAEDGRRRMHAWLIRHGVR